MKAIIGLLFTLTLLTIVGSAHAEGGCPEGFYPSSDPSIVGCAPIPGYTGSENIPDEQLARPSVRWAKTWGAIALDKERGIVGAVEGKTSKGQAQKAAIAECKVRGGGSGCKNISRTYHNQCAVVLAGEGQGIMTASAQTVEEARALAMQLCKKEGMVCRDYYAACSEPIRIQ
jgi:hypothetical protein